MKWIIVFFQVLVSTSDGEIIFSGLTVGQKMTKEIKTISAFYKTKIECEQKLKELKGNKNLKKVDLFNGEKSYMITDYQTLLNNERIVVNDFYAWKFLLEIWVLGNEHKQKTRLS